MDLHDAIYLHLKWCRRYGRIKMTGKEKWGMYRQELVQFWDGGLHYLICRSLVWIKYPFIYWRVDPVVKVLTKYTGIRWLFRKWQKFVWNAATQILCKRYPNLVNELLGDMGRLRGLVKPIIIFGWNIDGEEIDHDSKRIWK